MLLKNEEGILPLKKSDRILLVGPNANSMRTLNGGWSYTWQGDKTDEARFAGAYNTIYEALKAKFDRVEYMPVLEYSGGRAWEKEEQNRDCGWCEGLSYHDSKDGRCYSIHG